MSTLNVTGDENQKNRGKKKKNDKDFHFLPFTLVLELKKKSPALLDDGIDRAAQYLTTDFIVFIRDIYLTIYSYVSHTRLFLGAMLKSNLDFLSLYNVNRV
jgi:hypothetical protein